MPSGQAEVGNLFDSDAVVGIFAYSYGTEQRTWLVGGKGLSVNRRVPLPLQVAVAVEAHMILLAAAAPPDRRQIAHRHLTGNASV